MKNSEILLLVSIPAAVLLLSGLTAKIRETLAEERPDLNCRRVVEAVGRRCEHEINPSQVESETITPALTQSRSIRV